MLPRDGCRGHVQAVCRHADPSLMEQRRADLCRQLEGVLCSLHLPQAFLRGNHRLPPPPPIRPASARTRRHLRKPRCSRSTSGSTHAKSVSCLHALRVEPMPTSHLTLVNQCPVVRTSVDSSKRAARTAAAAEDQRLPAGGGPQPGSSDQHIRHHGQAHVTRLVQGLHVTRTRLSVRCLNAARCHAISRCLTPTLALLVPSCSEKWAALLPLLQVEVRLRVWSATVTLRRWFRRLARFVGVAGAAR